MVVLWYFYERVCESVLVWHPRTFWRFWYAYSLHYICIMYATCNLCVHVFTKWCYVNIQYQGVSVGGGSVPSCAEREAEDSSRVKKIPI